MSGGGILELVADGYRAIQVTRYSELAASVIVIYDHLITFDQEIQLVWKARWSLGKILFLLNRYYTLLLLVINNYAFFNNKLTDEVCTAFFRFQPLAFVMSTFLAQATLQLRLSALYSLNKPALAFMLTVSILCTISTAGIAVYAITVERATANLVPGLSFCVVLNLPSWFWAFWVPLLVAETTLFAFMLPHSFHAAATATHGSSGKKWRAAATGPLRTLFESTSRLVDLIIRDSLVYFLVIFVSHLLNCLIWALAPFNYLEVAIGYPEAMSCIMCSRMMLNVRDAHHQLLLERSNEAEPIPLRRVSILPRSPETPIYIEQQALHTKVWNGLS